MIDQTVSHYKITANLGEGGMGEVFLATDTKLDRQVALKFLPRHLSTDDEARARFEREAKALAALNHPNIVSVFDVSEHEGRPFITMEFVEGQSVKHFIDSGQADIDQVLDIISQISEGLAAAHARGIVHRDIKSDNVIISSEGRAKIVDFGLATWHGVSKVTKEGVSVGTMAYMSPEQATGDVVGPASDVFSFGVLAYELLTGRHPFQGEHGPAIIYGIVNERQKPIPELRRDVPDSLVSIVERCLEKDPQERFNDGSTLAKQLKKIRSGDLSVQNQRATNSAPIRNGMPTSMEQDIRFCTTRDGVKIAYSVCGTGPPLVRVLGWFTHLEMEWNWPDLRFFWETLAQSYTVIRYDGRGMGLSDRDVPEFSEETRRLDLEAVLDAAGLSKTALIGISEGGWTSAAYTVGHPERISHLILYGSYARGFTSRPGCDLEENKALVTLMRKGWGRETPAFRQLFTSQFYPEGSNPESVAHFNALQRASADPEIAARYLESCHSRGDGHHIFSKIGTPTLVVHRRGDLVTNFEEGRHLASIIPGAKFIPLSGISHYFPSDQPETIELVEAITRFLGS